MSALGEQAPGGSLANGAASPALPEADEAVTKARAREVVRAAVDAGKVTATTPFDAVRFQVDGAGVPAWALRGAWEEARARLEAEAPIAPPIPDFEPDGPPMGEPADTLAGWESGPHGDERPTIEIRAIELSRMIQATIKALGEGDENLFQRAGQLVRIVREPERREPYEADSEDPKRHDYRVGSNIITRPGTPRLADAGPTLLESADRCITWLRFDERRGEAVEKGKKGGKRTGEWVPADAHATVVKQIATRADWPGIRPIRGIIETACLAPSGRIIIAPGYDDETSHVLLPSVDVGVIAHAPPREHAKAALFYLWREIACDFPFKGVGEPSRNEAGEDIDPDRGLQYAKALESPDAFVGVAMLLTVFARLAISGAIPGGMFEAAARGSGKSLQMHTVAMIATSRPASVATFPTRDGKPNDEELEKVIMGYAQQASRLIAFDNIKGHLTGAALEKAMTSVESIEGRILGLTGQKSFPWWAALMFSGNNMTMSDDVADRVMVSRIESPREEPRRREAKTFRHPSLLAAIKVQRPRLVRAVLVILRSYLAAKEAGAEGVVERTRGSFESWARIIPGAIEWAGGPDILRAFPEGGSGGDEDSEAHATLLRYWRDEWQGQKVSYIHEAIFKGEHDREGGDGSRQDAKGYVDTQLEEVRSAVRALTRTREGAKPAVHALSMKMHKLRGTIRNGHRLEATKDAATNTLTYRVVKVSR